MKLTPQQKKKIQQLADRRGVTQKQAIMDLVNKAVEAQEEPIKAQPGSILERNRDLFGKSESGLSDISANVDKYLREWGFGK